MSNPFFTLNYEPAFQSLGSDYYDEVPAAEFPRQILRFRNDRLLAKLGLDPKDVKNEHFIEAFGKFHCVGPFLAMRYHGYQFGEYNPYLGDGRGFLYAQVRGIDGELYDFGTKGSGQTPYSRDADGRLTLKGGIREVLAGEMLHRLGVRTSRSLSLVETGESLWRGDEPSPTRSSVMVRFSRSHIRFGTFERLNFFRRKDLIQKLLDHVIYYYYPYLLADENKRSPQETYVLFYADLVKRVAELAAQWMAVGFCHGVLNTDNMSITGESFDYGPYGFIPSYKLGFIAAYFDYFGLYCYGNQAQICQENLLKLQVALGEVIEKSDMEAALTKFWEYYALKYRQLMINKLGFEDLLAPEAEELLKLTIKFLQESKVSYHDFFLELRQQFSPQWRDDASKIFSDKEPNKLLDAWRDFYYHLLQNLSTTELDNLAARLRKENPQQGLSRTVIESVWESISVDNNWQPFDDLVKRINES